MWAYPQGAGLGFRRDLIPQLDEQDLSGVDFFELAPENWLGIGGSYEHSLRTFTERFPFTCHGLSLSLGGTDPLDLELLSNIKSFMSRHGITLYSEHLSWCGHGGHLYDLLPVPFTEEAVKWISGRIRTTQSVLERQISVENSSYYFVPPDSELSEVEFINAVMDEADCLLHLDVNNLYVNSQNHGYDSIDFLQKLHLDRLAYVHVAGHYVEDDGWIVDTHGAAVVDPVWALLKETYGRLPYSALQVPTCLERDFNFPNSAELLQEVKAIKSLQERQRRLRTEAPEGG